MFKALSLKLDFDKNRVYGLDILRALAIFIVVITHAVSYCPAGVSKIIEAVYLDAVTIFFVLSGFLIGRIIIKTMVDKTPGYNTLANFWWRRWMRTLPIYFLILSLVILADHYYGPNGPTYKRFFIFSQNIFTPHPGFFIEAWSLSVEEWFYLTIPLFIFIFVKYFRISVFRSILILSILVILFSTSLRFQRYLQFATIDGKTFALYFRMQVITRLDSLMYGVIGALLSFFNPLKWRSKKGLKLLIGILMLVINKVLDDFGYGNAFVFYHSVFYLSTNAIGTLFMLPFLSNYKTGKGAFVTAVTYLSLISYSMYLINLTPMQDYIIPFINRRIIGNALGHNTILTTDLLIYLPLTFFGSLYLYKFIEKPFMNLRDKINIAVEQKKASNKHLTAPVDK